MTLYLQLSAFYLLENLSTEQHAHEVDFFCLDNPGDLLSMPAEQQ